jgi:4,5-DOPA dioxygenase extradiol
MSTLMPAIFFGHGNPLNALQQNAFTTNWVAIGAVLPRPKAILCISAHWYVEESAVTISTAPKTIHDFGGFPKELYQVRYPAPGDPELAARVQNLLAPLPVRFDESWGIDHGTWSVLLHVYPKADVPVVQLSINASQSPAFHYELGQRLAVLREEGILIMGSGNLVHNLQAYAWRDPAAGPYEWAVSFEQRLKQALLADQTEALIDYKHKLGPDFRLAVPTPDHYLPMLYVLGARQTSEAVSFPVEGIEGGSISMLAVQLG